MKPTPGPWKVHTERFGHDGRFTSLVIRGPLIIDEQTGMTPNPMYVCDVPQLANAHLIAAAPELLAALEIAMSMIKRKYHFDSDWAALENYSRMKNAIAKARGEK